MNTELQELLNNIASASHAERVQFGREHLKNFVNGLRAGGLNDEQITNAIISFTSLFISADKSCDYEEFELFRDITGIGDDYDSFYEATNGGSNPEFVEAGLNFARVLTREDRSSLLCYGAALVGSDGVVKSSEIALFEKLLNA